MFTKALFIDFKDGDIQPNYFARIRKLFGETKFILSTGSNLKESLKDTDVIFANVFTKIDKEVIDDAPNLKYIGVFSTAFDAIDTKYARSKKITVCNLGSYSTGAVSEFFFAILFEKVRELEKAKLQARGGNYSFGGYMGIELRNRTLGVVGAGKIGSRIAEIGLGIGMKVIYFSRENKLGIEKRGASKKDLNQVLSQSDFVSLNLALNNKTEKIINRERINLLKEGSIFINLAPPKLIDQEAMLEKANKGNFTFIFDHAYDINQTLAKRFLVTKNCIVYPMGAARTGEANTARWETFVSNIENFSKGKPANVIN